MHDYLSKNQGKDTVNKITHVLFGAESEVLNSNSKRDFDANWTKFEQKYGHCFGIERLEKLHSELWEYVVNPGILIPSLRPPFMNQR